MPRNREPGYTHSTNASQGWGSPHRRPRPCKRRGLHACRLPDANRDTVGILDASPSAVREDRSRCAARPYNPSRVLALPSHRRGHGNPTHTHLARPNVSKTQGCCAPSDRLLHDASALRSLPASTSSPPDDGHKPFRGRFRRSLAAIGLRRTSRLLHSRACHGPSGPTGMSTGQERRPAASG